MCMVNAKGKLRCMDVNLGQPKTHLPNKFNTNIKKISAGMNSSSAIAKNGVLKFW